MSADKKQEGGGHYKSTPEHLQHWTVVSAMGWDYFIGSATKYIWRLGKKGDEAKAIEDISKAIHYLEKKRELMVADSKPPEMSVAEAEDIRDRALRLLGGQPAFYEEECDGGPTPGYINQDR